MFLMQYGMNVSIHTWVLRIKPFSFLSEVIAQLWMKLRTVTLMAISIGFASTHRQVICSHADFYTKKGHNEFLDSLNL